MRVSFELDVLEQKVVWFIYENDKLKLNNEKFWAQIAFWGVWSVVFFLDALESQIDRTLISAKRDLTWVDFIIQNKNNLGLC